jgi:hypothetical protein
MRSVRMQEMGGETKHAKMSERREWAYELSHLLGLDAGPEGPASFLRVGNDRKGEGTADHLDRVLRDSHLRMREGDKCERE